MPLTEVYCLTKTRNYTKNKQKNNGSQNEYQKTQNQVATKKQKWSFIESNRICQRLILSVYKNQNIFIFPFPLK